MKIDRATVEYIAELARIELQEDEQDARAEEFSEILGFFDRLKQVDTASVPPTSHVLDLVNALREDEPRPSLDPDEALKNAPDRDGSFFRVPRILD